MGIEAVYTPALVKAYGRTPSLGSQMNLWHSDDYNSYTKVHKTMTMVKKFVEPITWRKDFHSHELNTVLPNLRVTASTLYAIDDAGGFDNYIMRTHPSELRSCFGEKLKNLMYFYQDNPDVKEWGLPHKVLLRNKEQKDLKK